jgi:hypothetical protein
MYYETNILGLWRHVMRRVARCFFRRDRIAYVLGKQVEQKFCSAAYFMRAAMATSGV